MQHRESPPTRPSIEESPKLEFKPLAPHLRYVFLGRDNPLPIIIASDLNVHQVESLVNVFKNSKKL